MVQPLHHRIQMVTCITNITLTFDKSELAALPLVFFAVGNPVQEDVISVSFHANGQGRRLRSHRVADRRHDQRRSGPPVKNCRLAVARSVIGILKKLTDRHTHTQTNTERERERERERHLYTCKPN